MVLSISVGKAQIGQKFNDFSLCGAKATILGIEDNGRVLFGSIQSKKDTGEDFSYFDLGWSNHVELPNLPVPGTGNDLDIAETISYVLERGQSVITDRLRKEDKNVEVIGFMVTISNSSALVLEYKEKEQYLKPEELRQHPERLQAMKEMMKKSMKAESAGDFAYYIFRKDILLVNRVHGKWIVYRIKMSDVDKTKLENRYKQFVKCFQFTTPFPKLSVSPLAVWAEKLEAKLEGLFPLEKIYINQKEYDRTKYFSLPMNSRISKHDPYSREERDTLRLAIANKRGSNLHRVVLYFNDYDRGMQKHYFKGDVLIYLDNGAVIRCVDRDSRGYVDDNSYGSYNLTQSEIELLKRHKINSVSFFVTGESGSEKRNITADIESDEDTAGRVRVLLYRE